MVNQREIGIITIINSKSVTTSQPYKQDVRVICDAAVATADRLSSERGSRPKVKGRTKVCAPPPLEASSPKKV